MQVRLWNRRRPFLSDLKPESPQINAEGDPCTTDEGCVFTWRGAATEMNLNRCNRSGSSRTRANATQPYNGLVTKRSCITLWLCRVKRRGRGPFLMQKAIYREMRWISWSSSIGRAWSPGALTEWPPIEGNFNIYQQPRFVSCS